IWTRTGPHGVYALGLSSPLVQGSAVWTVSHAEILYSATAASAAFGLDGPLEFIGSAQAHGARLWIAPLPTS
ncbi:MAG: hypothetical protein WAM50_06345, partial [Pseudolabrys sp.]